MNITLHKPHSALQAGLTQHIIAQTQQKHPSHASNHVSNVLLLSLPVETSGANQYSSQTLFIADGLLTAAFVKGGIC